MSSSIDKATFLLFLLSFCILHTMSMEFSGLERNATFTSIAREGEEFDLLFDVISEEFTRIGLVFTREDMNHSEFEIEEFMVHHVTRREGKENKYLNQYTRSPYGYLVATDIPLEIAREYLISVHFNMEAHKLILWKDIDNMAFCISHTWNILHIPTMDSEKCQQSENGATTIRPACYNIWNLNDEWEDRSEMIIENILAEAADFVALQEVRYNILDEYQYKRAGRDRLRFQIDLLKKQLQLKDLSSSTPWQYHYQPAMSYLDQFHTDEGVALISRFPISDYSSLFLSRDLDDTEDAHQRIVLRTELQTPLGLVQVFNTHFALTEVARRRAVLELFQWIQQFPLPHILMGDLNAEPDDIALMFLVGSEEIEGLRGDFVDAFDSFSSPDDAPFTFPAWEPIKRIDFMLLRGFTQVEGCTLLGTNTNKRNTNHPDGKDLWSSDHFGLACSLSTKKNEK